MVDVFIDDNANLFLDTLHKMCSFFDAFDEVFGSRIIEADIIEETLDSSNNITEMYDITEIETNDTSIVSESSPIECDILLPTSRKEIYSRTAVSDIMQILSEMVAIKKQKMDQDREIKNREMDIKEREVIVKEKEMSLKEKEMLSNEKLKILELEMKERLAMEELKLKYKLL